MVQDMDSCSTHCALIEGQAGQRWDQNLPYAVDCMFQQCAKACYASATVAW
jgi:hypothetical protein